MIKPALSVCGLLALWAAGPPSSRQSVQEPQDPEREALEQAFRLAGIRFDAASGACAFPASVEVRDELLEYLLVLPIGAAHESLFLTGSDPEVLNAALLALGVGPGSNAEWIEKTPPPSEEELRAGASPYQVVVPAGDGFYLYATWREGDELYFYRVEDLVRDLDSGRTMRRHRWTYLGSRMVERRDGEQSFAASLEGNLINIAFFAQGNTLVTAALAECVKQTVWLPNGWLLPDRGSPVLLILARERLERLPDALAEAVPSVPAASSDGGWRR